MPCFDHIGQSITATKEVTTHSPHTSGADLNSTPWIVSLSQYDTYVASVLSFQEEVSGMELLSPLATMLTLVYLQKEKLPTHASGKQSCLIPVP